MRKVWRLVFGLALAVPVLTAIGFAIRSQWLPPEPSYQGKPLSYWLPRVIMENPGGIHYNHDHCREAVAAIGLPAIPFILVKLRNNDSPSVDSYRKLWPRLPPIITQFFPQPKLPDFFAQDAAAALMCLGTNAIPALVDAIEDSKPTVREAAAQALVALPAVRFRPRTQSGFLAKPSRMKIPRCASLRLLPCRASVLPLPIPYQRSFKS